MNKRNPLLEQFGNIIKNKRLEKGISSQAFSDMMKISRATLSSIENGIGNVSINTYLDITKALEIKVILNYDKTEKNVKQRCAKRLTKETVKRNQFEVFCIEKYAYYTGSNSNTVYSIFKKKGLLNLLRTDYEDLHGMGTEYLMSFFDSYLEKSVL